MMRQGLRLSRQVQAEAPMPGKHRQSGKEESKEQGTSKMSCEIWKRMLAGRQAREGWRQRRSWQRPGARKLRA